MNTLRGRPPQDLTGQRFGRLVCINRLPVIQGKRAKWNCRCDCGKMAPVSVSHLLKGVTKSCGCLQIEGLIARRRTHGMWLSPEYAAWHHMKQRCTSPTHPAWKNYGGRGITVCPEWMNDFAAFLAHIGPRPDPKLTLERINNEGGYEPGNVKWATRSEQSRNQRRRHKTNPRIAD